MKTKLAECVKALRKQYGMTQEDLGKPVLCARNGAGENIAAYGQGEPSIGFV